MEVEQIDVGSRTHLLRECAGTRTRTQEGARLLAAAPTGVFGVVRSWAVARGGAVGEEAWSWEGLWSSRAW